MDIKEKVLNKVKQNIKKYNMIKEKDIVCVGLSGGADSVCLFFCLYLLQSEFDFKLIAAHINHGIREEAYKDVLFCKNLCETYNVDFYLKEVNIKELSEKIILAKKKWEEQLDMIFLIVYVKMERLLQLITRMIMWKLFL